VSRPGGGRASLALGEKLGWGSASAWPSAPPSNEETEVEVGDPRPLANALSWGTPQLVRLRQLVADLTLDDRIDDPFLEDLILPLSGDPLALRHARMTLLRARKLPARRPEAVGDFRGAVAHLVRDAVPAAQLLIESPGTYLLPQRDRVETADADDLLLVPPAAPLLIGRGDSLYAYDPVPRWSRARAQWEETLDPQTHDRRNDDEDDEDDNYSEELASSVQVARWEEAFAGWQERRQPAQRAHQNRSSFLDWVPRLHTRLVERVVYEASESSTPAPTPWGRDFATLDVVLGTVWLALRRVGQATEMVELPTGERLVAIGGGLCLAVAVHRHPRRGGTTDVRAAFRTTMAPDGSFSPLVAPVRPSERGLPVELPADVYVTGVGLSLSARFTFSPWLTDSPTDTAASYLRGAAALFEAPLR
jgi:hypothetical protein